jgi:ketosteroid isomerase-like protein
MSTDAAAVQQAVAKANARFAGFAAAKDYKGMASCYGPDAVLMPPGAPMIKGRDEIAAFWASAAAALGLQAASLTTRLLEVQGDTAREAGDAELKLTSGVAKVKYVVIWKRAADGAWRMHWDMWNDLPG